MLLCPSNSHHRPCTAGVRKSHAAGHVAVLQGGIDLGEVHEVLNLRVTELLLRARHSKHLLGLLGAIGSRRLLVVWANGVGMPMSIHCFAVSFASAARHALFHFGDPLGSLFSAFLPLVSSCALHHCALPSCLRHEDLQIIFDLLQLCFINFLLLLGLHGILHVLCDVDAVCVWPWFGLPPLSKSLGLFSLYLRYDGHQRSPQLFIFIHSSGRRHDLLPLFSSQAGLLQEPVGLGCPRNPGPNFFQPFQLGSEGRVKGRHLLSSGSAKVLVEPLERRENPKKLQRLQLTPQVI